MTIAAQLVRAVVAVTLATGLVTATHTPTTPTDRVRAGEFWLSEYGFAHAWAVSRGAGPLVAVIDDPIPGGVSDLNGVLAGPSALMPDSASHDDVGHGVAAAALLAGRGHDPDAGMLGAAPQARVLSIVNATGSVGIGAAIRYAVDHRARVVSISQASAGGRCDAYPSPALQRDVAYAESHDVVVVAGSGNRSDTAVGEPACLPGVVSVTGALAGGTSDPQSSHGPQVALAAASATRRVAHPRDGSSEGFLVPTSPDAPNNGADGAPRGYAWFSGTSASAPIVAGVAVLLRAAHPDWSAARVIWQLIKTATDRGPTGRDTTYGFGIVNAGRALTDDSVGAPPGGRNPLGVLPGGEPPASSPSVTPSPSGARSGTASEHSNPATAGTGHGGSALGLVLGLALAAAALVSVLAAGVLVSVRARSRAARTPASHPPPYPPYRPPF